MVGIAAGFAMRPLMSAYNARPPDVPSAGNTVSAVSAASCRPASEAPAWTITGHPWIGRAMFSGPRTE